MLSTFFVSILYITQSRYYPVDHQNAAINNISPEEMHSKCTEKAEKMLHHHLPLINHLPKMILGRKEIDKDTDKGDRGGLLQEEKQEEEKKFLRFTWMSSLIAGLFVDTQLSTRNARVNERKKTSHFPWTNNQGTRIREDWLTGNASCYTRTRWRSLPGDWWPAVVVLLLEDPPNRLSGQFETAGHSV